MLTFLVHHLLSFPGIDVNIKDNRGLTALDTVRDLPSQKSQQIAALIEGVGHRTSGDQGQLTYSALCLG